MKTLAKSRKTSCRRCCTSLFTPRLSSHTTVYFGAMECRSGQVRKYLLSAPCWARLADGLDSIPGRGSIKAPAHILQEKKKKNKTWSLLYGNPFGESVATIHSPRLRVSKTRLAYKSVEITQKPTYSFFLFPFFRSSLLSTPWASKQALQKKNPYHPHRFW